MKIYVDLFFYLIPLASRTFLLLCLANAICYSSLKTYWMRYNKLSLLIFSIPYYNLKKGIIKMLKIF